MSLSQSLELSQSLKLELTLFLGETIGDIPVYSLHRIKNLLTKMPMSVSGEMKIILQRQLTEAKKTYKEESGNDWNCLTSHNLIQAIDGADQEAVGIIEKSLVGQPRECIEQVAELKKHFLKLKDEQIAIIKKWFEENYDQLLYDMDGKIPWGVIQKLRRNLSVWIAGTGNLFYADIKDAIIDVARECGIETENVEDAWRKMGGKLFRNREKDKNDEE